MVSRTMRLLAGAAVVAVAGLAGAAANAEDHQLGVSWRHFQEERWKIDERGITDALNAAGGWDYISADAQGDPQKQLSDVENLIAQGADALIILAQDSQAIKPAIERAVAEGIPVVAYDAPVDAPGVLFVSFDNIAVGRLMAQAMVDVKPNGNWVLIEGDPSHPIVDVFRQGQMEVLKPLIDSGAIKIVAQQNIENWKPDVAQTVMDQILTANDNKVDAVLAMNDGTSTGVAAALAAQGLLGIPLSGQDGDHAVLNRIAKGQQTVTVWKNAYDLGQAAAKAAIAMGSGTAMDQVPGVTKYTTPSGIIQDAILLNPVAITRDNLNLVVDANWISKEELCEGVTENAPDACK